jgi:hypothetical protein
VPDIELDLGVQLIASLEGLTARLDREERDRQRMSQAIRQIPLAANQPNAAGVIDDPAQLRANTGYYWSVRRLVLSGFSAGSAIVYKNALGGEVMEIFTAAASMKYARSAMLLAPGDRLIVQVTGITGTVQLNGAADCFETWYLPQYIG